MKVDDISQNIRSAVMMNQAILLLTMLLAMTRFTCHARHAADCDYYLMSSRNPASKFGTSIIAGRKFEPGASIEDQPGVLVPIDSIRGTPLMDYVYGVYDYNVAQYVAGYVKVVFGLGVLLNRNANASRALVHYSAQGDATLVAAEREDAGHSGYDSFTIPDIIQPGEEMFSFYAGKSVDIDTSQSPYSIKELEEIGCCLSHVYVGESSFPDAGKGLYAKKDFRAGEVVSVSPALLLRLDSVALQGVLENYVIASPGSGYSGYALLPTGLPAMLNHQPEHMASVTVRRVNEKISTQNLEVCNVERDIDKEATLSLDDRTEQNNNGHACALSSSPNNHETARVLIPLDQLSSPPAQANLEYVALRDIAAGEELSMFYGRSWETAWRNFLGPHGKADATLKGIRLESKIFPDQHTNLDAAGETNASRILFRHPIEAPQTLVAYDSPNTPDVNESGHERKGFCCCMTDNIEDFRNIQCDNKGFCEAGYSPHKPDLVSTVGLITRSPARIPTERHFREHASPSKEKGSIESYNLPNLEPISVEYSFFVSPPFPLD